MKILITGANGLVGLSLTQKFAKAGYEVFVLTRKHSDREVFKNISGNIHLLTGDVLDILTLEKAIEQVSCVIHAAAVVSFVPQWRQEMYKTNVEGTANVVNVCLAKGIEKLCFVSSVAALGKPADKNDTKRVINEEQKWEESPLNSHYAKSKYLAECEVWRGQAEGLNTIIVNPSLVLGEGNWNKSSAKIFKYVFDENVFYTNGIVNYVDINDLTEAIFCLLRSDISGERFIVSGGTTTYQALFTKIADGFHKKPPKIAIKQSFAEVIWRIEALRAMFRNKEPLITKETARTARSKFVYDNQKIKQTLVGFEFNDLNETISRVCEKLKIINAKN